MLSSHFIQNPDSFRIGTVLNTVIKLSSVVHTVKVLWMSYIGEILLQYFADKKYLSVFCI